MSKMIDKSEFIKYLGDAVVNLREWGCKSEATTLGNLKIVVESGRFDVKEPCEYCGASTFQACVDPGCPVKEDTQDA